MSEVDILQDRIKKLEARLAAVESWIQLWEAACDAYDAEMGLPREGEALDSEPTIWRDKRMDH